MSESQTEYKVAYIAAAPSPDAFRQVTERMAATYTAKNAAYGDSYSQLFAEFGPLAAVVPLANKLNRIKSLIRNPELAGNNESLRDSVLDLANYAVMFAMELDKS